MSNLITVLLIAYVVCAYLITYHYAKLIFKGATNQYYEFKIRWYHKAASTYVLALPIYLLSVYLLSEVLA